MDIAPQNIDWHFDILPRQTKKALDFLSNEKWLVGANWYLAGGTALALQAGHRISVDLDFFTTKKDFNEKKLLEHFLGHSEWQTTLEDVGTIYGELCNAKVSFISYPFFVPKQTLCPYGTVAILHPIDIAVMKIIAISQRGRKRDFFDSYWCAHNIEALEKSIRRLKVQYPTVAHNYHHILKALVYFGDAEGDPEPTIYFDTHWKQVKKFFTKEIPLIADKLIR